MLAIIDSRAPKEAVINLRKHVDEVFLFKTDGITLDPISCHPDIFIYQDSFNLVIAPNAPKTLFDFLDINKVSYLIGNSEVGVSFEKSVLYNCISSSINIFHKKGFTDSSILLINQEKEFINIPQAYTRCSLTHLSNNHFITSDKGIEKNLLKKGIDCFYFSPNQISIIGHNHGFFGGTNAFCNGKIFFIGNIDLHEKGNDLRKYIQDKGIEIICLNNDFLYDGGGIFFIKKNN